MLVEKWAEVQVLFHREGLSQQAIARRLGYVQIEIAMQIRSRQSTFTRELARLARGVFVVWPAQEHADQRRHTSSPVRHLRRCIKQRNSITQAVMFGSPRAPDRGAKTVASLDTRTATSSSARLGTPWRQPWSNGRSRLTLLIKVCNEATREVAACVPCRLRAAGAVVNAHSP